MKGSSMEIGFYHPTVGYWQTTNEPSPEVLSNYPQGTVQVPLKPSGDYEWDGQSWGKLPVDLQALGFQVRLKRDRLLSASDWTQVADAPVDQAAWATYRQALRDIPDQVGFPENVTWPTKPE